MTHFHAEGYKLSKVVSPNTSAVADILTEATQFKLSRGDKSWGLDGWRVQEITDRMAEGYEYFALYEGANIAAIAALLWSDDREWGPRADDSAYLHNLAVAEVYRGHHIGEFMIEWLVGVARQKGKIYLRLDCDNNNIPLKDYYEGLGFVCVGLHERPDAELGIYQAALYQRKL